ncbi:MAG: M48 family metallopeptidase, partial [Cytophagales bacterium]|nr:M48 family metallopeptidase [Cytophaga sp.]
MIDYEVNYYSGKTSVCNKAILHLHETTWIIAYSITKGEEEKQTEVIWDLDQIHKAQTLAAVTVFKYGSFPHQSIDYSNTALSEAIQTIYSKPFFDRADVFIHTINLKKILLLISGFLGFIACAYFFIIPFIAVQVVEDTPKEYDVELGKVVYEQLSEAFEIDSVATTHINNYADNINFNTPFNIDIVVVKNETVNAFALPGGKIVVYDGILKNMNRHEELAALLSHEVSHINHRHSIKSIAKSLSGYLFLSILTNDVNGITSMLVSNADMFNSLHYSRTLEDEADTEGLQILLNNHIDQKGFVY